MRTLALIDVPKDQKYAIIIIIDTIPCHYRLQATISNLLMLYRILFYFSQEPGCC